MAPKARQGFTRGTKVTRVTEWSLERLTSLPLWLGGLVGGGKVGLVLPVGPHRVYVAILEERRRVRTFLHDKMRREKEGDMRRRSWYYLHE